MPARDINLATVDGKELPAVGGNNDLPNDSVVVRCDGGGDAMLLAGISVSNSFD